MNEITAARFELEVPLAEKNVLCEMSDDYTLPDYMPPIKRVISVDATVSAPESYVSPSGCELGGNMRYRLLYEGGEDGGVWCIELPAEYETAMSLEGEAPDNEKCHCRATAVAETPTVRVIAPRRVNIRSRVRVRAAVGCNAEFECACRGESVSESDVRCLEGVASAMQTLCGRSDAIALNDSFEVGETEELRVVCCRGEVMITSAEARRTGVACSGELQLKILLCREGEGERPYAVTRKIPVSGEAAYLKDVRDGAELMGACGWGELASCGATVADGHLVCEAEVVLCGEAQAKYPFTYLRDVYALSNASETSSRRIQTRRPIGCINGNVSINGSIGVDGVRLDGGMKICDVRGVASPDVSFDFVGNRMELSGKVRCTVITDNGSELASHELEIPYKYSTDIGEIPTDAELCPHAVVSVGACRGRIDGEELVVDAELYVAAAVAAKSSVDAITEVRFGSMRRAPDGSPRHAARITVCYPCAGESLWSVSKRYGVDPVRVATDNGIEADAPDSAESLANVGFLIV